MTKNISSTKSGHRSGNPKTDKKSSQTVTSNTTNSNHSQNELTAAAAAAHKASIDSKMLTPEQRRLASLMNDKIDVTDIEKKINKIMELTGSSKDKAIVALHDCANELDKAIDMILEGDSINESEWKSQARKKKPKTITGKETDNKAVHLNGDSKKSGKLGAGGNRQPRGKQQTSNDKQYQQSNQRDTNKSERTFNKREFKSTREQNNNNSNSEELANNKETNTSATTTTNTTIQLDEEVLIDDENQTTTQQQQSTTHHQQSNQRDTNKPPFNSRIRSSTNDNQFKSYKSNYNNRDNDDNRRPPRDRDNRDIRENRDNRDNRDLGRERGERSERNSYNSNRNTYSGPNDRRDNRDSRDQRGSRTFQNKNYQRKPGEHVRSSNQYTNSIDTWSNMTTQESTNPAATNDYTQMTVGNWSDVVSSTVQHKSTNLNTAAVTTKLPTANEELNETDKWQETTATANLIEQATNKVFNKDSQNNNNSTTQLKDDHQQIKMPNLASIVSGVKPTTQQVPQQQQPTNQLNKSPNQKQQQQPQTISQLSGQQTTNHQLSNSQHSTSLHKSSQSQGTLQQQQPNKIDLAALLKTSQPTANQQQNTQTNQQSNASNLMNRGNIQQQQQQQQQRTSNDSNTYGAALLQRLQRQPINNEPNKTNLNDYVNQYSNQQISNKNLVHNIPSNQFNTQTTSNQLFDNHHLHQTGNDHQTSLNDQKSLIEKTKRRQTKIPETAVEMPTSDHISSLNVQFGALDFGTDSYSLNDNNENKQNPASLLSTIRGDNHQFSSRSNQTNDNKQQQNTGKDQTSLLQQDNNNSLLLDSRNKIQQQQQPTGYQQKTASSLYGNQQQDNHQIYPPNLAQQYGYSSTSNNQSNYSNYGNQNHNQSNTSNSNQSTNNQQNTSNPNSNQNQSTNSQKINLKDLADISSNNNSNQINTTSSSLGNLVSNTTVTTNVLQLKNSLTATGKNMQQQQQQQQTNVAAASQQQQNVAPLLGTPQYIMNMSQPGLPAFYPININYDLPMATADHNAFRYQNTQDVKYNRQDASDNSGVPQSDPHNVQSTQAQVNQQSNHQIFSQIGQFPHPYGFFYTTGMMQGLYPPGTTPAATFLPVQPGVNPPSSNQHTNSNHSTGFAPKTAQNQQAYSQSYSNANAYDPSLTAQLQSQQDYNKAAQQQNAANYGSGPTQSGNNQNQQQTGKQMSNSGTNDLNSNMYTKSHAQLTKNYDKSSSFQTGVGTPPPFGITALGYSPQYMPMLPQSNPSMLHHTLQADTNQSVNNTGVSGNQRGSLSKPQQQQTSSNPKNYYNWS